MARFLAWFFSLIVIIVCLGILYWLTSSHEQWRDYLTKLASEQLGRELKIEGELKPGFSLTDGLTLRVTKLSLANAAGYAPAAMLTVPEMELAVDARALFSNTIHVRGFTLKGASLTLERRANGDDNYSFTAQKKTKSAEYAPAVATSDGKVFAFAADDINVEDLSLVMKSPGETKTYRIDNLIAAAPADKNFTATIEAMLDDKKLEADIKTGPLKTLLDGMKQPVELDLSYDGLEAKVAGSYSRHNATHRLYDTTFAVDGVEGKGNIEFTQGTARPYIMAAVKVDEIDLGGSDESVASKAKATAAAPQPVFSRAPLPWDALSQVDGKIALDAAATKRNGKKFGPLHLEGELKNGSLSSSIVAQPPGAPQAITIGVNASMQRNVALQFRAPALDAVLWAGLLGEDPLVLAPAAITLDVTGRGESLHDIAATSNGTLKFVAQPGRLNAAALPDEVRRPLSAVIGAEKLDKARLGCMKADMVIQNGIAHTQGVGLSSDVIAASVGGTADLGQEKLNLSVVATPRIEGLQDSYIPINVAGKLNDPDYSADVVGAAGQVAGKLVNKFAGKEVGGLVSGLLGGKSSQQQAGSVAVPPNPCIAQAEAAPADTATPQQQPAAQGPDAVTAPGAGGALGRILTGPKNALDGLLGR